MRKVDRRVRRTRRLLRDACVELILEKGYEDVTVEEITDRADVGRTTFYMHFKDKADLFAHSISEISDELYEQIAPLAFSREGNVEEAPVLMMLKHAEANKDLYRVILSGAGNGSGLKQLRRDLVRYISRVLEAEATALDLAPTIPIEIITHHFVGSLVALALWWLEHDLPYTAEEITRMLRTLTNKGRSAVMGKVV